MKLNRYNVEKYTNIRALMDGEAKDGRLIIDDSITEISDDAFETNEDYSDFRSKTWLYL